MGTSFGLGVNGCSRLRWIWWLWIVPRELVPLPWLYWLCKFTSEGREEPSFPKLSSPTAPVPGHLVPQPQHSSCRWGHQQLHPQGAAPGPSCAWLPPSFGVGHGQRLRLPGQGSSSQSCGQSPVACHHHSHIVPCCKGQSLWVSFTFPAELTALWTTKVPFSCLCSRPACQLNRCCLLQMSSRLFLNWQMAAEYIPDSIGDKCFFAVVCGELPFCIICVLQKLGYIPMIPF